jgi:transglycosylase-like protein with SLT domain/D-alanyl-D-alanine carboxypeptidase-like protein
VGNFYTDVIQNDSRYNSPEPIRDENLLEPHFRAEVNAIVTDAANEGTQLRVLETYRSQERQAVLFTEGTTQLRRVGVHHYGLACDFGIVRNGQIDWHADYGVIGRIAERRGLVWGGRFSFHDDGHVQAVSVADQPKLFAGTWYPEFAVAAASAPVAALALATFQEPAPPGQLNDGQNVALAAIDRVNPRFNGWFVRSSLMAFIQIESNFNPLAFRQEPSGVASYGLMQVLDTTASGLGLKGSPEQMYDPDTSVFYGALYASKGWQILQKRFNRAPTYAEWADGYNHGYGAHHLGGGAYAKAWLAARDHWAPLVDS